MALNLPDISEYCRILFEHAIDGIAILDLDGNVAEVNSSFALMYGYTAEECRRMNIRDLETLQNEKIFPERMSRLLVEEALQFESEHRHRDGHVIALRIHASIVDADGEKCIIAFHRDISEERRAKYLLKKGEQRFQSLIEQAPIAIVLTRDGLLLYGNKQFCKLSGFEAMELPPKMSVYELFAPEFRDASIARTKRRSLGLTVPEEFESVLLRRDASRVPVHVAISQVELPDGPAILAIVTDISAYKLSQEALRASEEEFRYVFEHSMAGQSLTLPTGELNVNARLCAMLGYTREELLVRKWMDITVPEDIPMTQSYVDILVSGKQDTVQFEKRFVHKDGRTIWVDLSSSLRRDAEGNPLYLMSSLVDITERKQAEKALKDKSDDLQATLDVIPDLLFELDSDWRIRRYHAAKHLRLYTSPERFLGKTVGEVLPSDAATLIEDALRDAAEHGWHSGQTYALDYSDERHWFELSISRRGGIENQSPFFVVMARDITQRKNLEIEHEQVIAKLEEAVANVKILGGLIPICGWCKKIRDDSGYWNQLEKYLSDHTNATLSHGICPDCLKEFFPEAPQPDNSRF